jgi:hypothetical protein
LGKLVDWNVRRTQEVKVQELQESLSDMITSDPPATPAEALTHVKSKVAEHRLPER